MTNDTKHMLEVRPLSLVNKTIVVGERQTRTGRPLVAAICMSRNANKRLIYHRGTARRAMLANSCYVSRDVGGRKETVQARDIFAVED